MIFETEPYIEDGQRYRGCPNTLGGKHAWRDNLAKNRGKPKLCINCNQLGDDLKLPNVRKD